MTGPSGNQLILFPSNLNVLRFSGNSIVTCLREEERRENEVVSILKDFKVKLVKIMKKKCKFLRKPYCNRAFSRI